MSAKDVKKWMISTSKAIPTEIQLLYAIPLAVGKVNYIE
jgi:hypothetical protein